jgi:hypothetical protein
MKEMSKIDRLVIRELKIYREVIERLTWEDAE